MGGLSRASGLAFGVRRSGSGSGSLSIREGGYYRFSIKYNLRI
jgi:hypothetical protein